MQSDACAVNPEALQAIDRLIDSLPDGQATVLDPGDPDHRAAIEAALDSAGRTADRYPGLHGALANSTGSEPDTIALVDKGVDSGGRATAMTWHATATDTLYSGGTLFALDGNGGELLALGHNSNVGEGFVPVSTDTSSAKPATPGGLLKLLAVNHAVASDGTARFTALASTATLAETGNGANIQVFEPTQTPKVPPNVVIALGRDSAHPNNDADYTFTEPYNLDTPWLIVPFMGSAELPYEVNGTAGLPIANATYASTVFYVVSGKTIPVALDPTYTPMSRVSSGITLSKSDPYTVNFEFPADGASYDTTGALVYGQESQANEQIAYFLFTFVVPVVGSSSGFFSFAVCSVNTPNEPTYQCYNIPNIMFWWHCVAEGTQVTLADGSTAAIETLTNQHRVATGSGTTLAVEATSRGAHDPSDSGANATFRLTTEAGKSLVATGKHAISTPDGLVALADLAAGDTIYTADGPERIESVDPASAGTFYNLKLGDEGDRDNGDHEHGDVTTYIANGIVVGDHLAMNLHYRERVRDVAFMTSRIPPAFADDYASAVADSRY